MKSIAAIVQGAIISVAFLRTTKTKQSLSFLLFVPSIDAMLATEPLLLQEDCSSGKAI